MTGRAVERRRAFPRLPVFVFAIVLALALSPNIVHVYGIHNDYEMLVYKSHGFFHTEADQLLSVARPLPALLTNLPILPLEDLPDWRWVRIFSLLTVCLAGAQLISICIGNLRVTKIAATAIACVTFLGLPYIYSILQPAAWAPHLVTTVLALAGYAVLSRTNMQALAFLGPAARRDYRSLWWQAVAYFADRRVQAACILFQLALYGYPPNALILALMPVVAILFARAPDFYRLTVAVRDIVFMIVNMAAYMLFTKLVFLPVVRLFVYRNSEAWRSSAKLSAFDQRVAPSYSYSVNTDVVAYLRRMGHALRVSADLWFPDQYHFDLVVAAVVVAALIAANVAVRRRSALEKAAATPLSAALDLVAWRTGAVRSFVVVAICFVLAASPILASGGGFVTYRTVPIPCALLGVVFLYGLGVLAEQIWQRLGRAPGPAAAAGFALGAAIALAGNFYTGYMTMRLARNEFLYFKDIVRQAMADKSSMIIVIDPRPFSLPEDIATVVDQHGRALPPYELGCLSSYCLQTGAILRVAAAQLGWHMSGSDIQIIRGGIPLKGATCDLLTGDVLTFPPGASEREKELVRYLHGRRPTTCVDFSLGWHDLGVDLGAR